METFSRETEAKKLVEVGGKKHHMQDEEPTGSSSKGCLHTAS
jgi:hypothetical protein